MPKITIYTTATCGYCRILKGYLQQQSIPFSEKQADQDPALAKELYEESQQLGVPFTVIEKDNGEEVRILGFDKLTIDSALGLK